VQCITWGTDDFWLVGTFSDTPSFSNFAYSVSGVSDIFESNTGTLTVDVPEPTSIALFFLGLFALGFALRKKA
ncbi:MAG: PEP-CTERM sorting domain-containing protein, partial [Burkholderiaceae bacterium]